MLIDDLLPQLLADVPGCPDATARAAMVNAAIALCRESQAWREIQDPITLIDGQHTYDLDVPVDAKPVGAASVWLPGRRVVSKTMDQIEVLMPSWQSATGSAPLYFHNVAGASAIRVFPIPQNSQRARLTIRAIYQPKLGATTLPDALIDAAFETILEGARMRLFAMPKKDWSDAGLASAHGTLFNNGVVDLRIRTIHEDTPGTLTVVARRFGF